MTTTQIATKEDLDTFKAEIDAEIATAGGVAGPQGAPGTPGTVWTSGTTVPSSGTGNNGDFFLKTDTYDLYKKTGGAWAVLVNIKGAQGTQGAGGAAGATWYSGAGAPTSQGAVNDFYIDLTPGALKIYGPKTNAGWGAGATISGVNGTNGAAGTSVLTGSGTPSSGTGNNGDIYFDRTNLLLYGPKASGAWPGTGTKLNPINFVSDGGANTTYTLSTADDGKDLGFGAGAGNVAITVPKLPMNFGCNIWHEGSGVISLVADGTTSIIRARGVVSTTTIHHPGFSDAIGLLTRYSDSSYSDTFVTNGVT